MWCIRRIVLWRGRCHAEYLSMADSDPDFSASWWGPATADYTHFNDYYSAYQVLERLDDVYGVEACHIEKSPDYVGKATREERLRYE